MGKIQHTGKLASKCRLAAAVCAEHDYAVWLAQFHHRSRDIFDNIKFAHLNHFLYALQSLSVWIIETQSSDTDITESFSKYHFKVPQECHNRHGFCIYRHFPKQLLSSVRRAEVRIPYPNGDG